MEQVLQEKVCYEEPYGVALFTGRAPHELWRVVNSTGAYDKIVRSEMGVSPSPKRATEKSRVLLVVLG